MKKRLHKKLVHEGPYVAEVEVELIDTDEGWSPYLSLDDANKLDDVRMALEAILHPQLACLACIASLQ